MFQLRKNWTQVVQVQRKENENYKPRAQDNKFCMNGRCQHCGKYGHTINECWDLQKGKDDDTANIADDLLLMGVDNKSDEDSLFDIYIYIYINMI